MLTPVVAGAQSDNTCVTITTGNADGDSRPTTVLLESTDGDYGKVKETTEASDLDVCSVSEDLDHVIHYAAPAGEYLVQVRYDEPPVNERWGNFERTVEDTDEESFWLLRKAPYHTSVDIESTRGTNRFTPGESGDFDIRIYNGDESDSKDVTTEVYVYPEGDSRPSEPTKTLSTVSIAADRKETVEGTIPIPDSEGTYTVDVEVVTDFGFRRLTSDYVNVGEITVDNFEPPEIDNSSPRDSAVTMAEDESTTFTVSASDPDTSSGSLTHTWYVDGQEVTTGESFQFDSGGYGGGKHDVEVVVSDSTDATQDVSESWAIEVLEAPSIERVSPGSSEANVGSSITFSADATDPGGYSPVSYEWTIDGRTYQGADVSQTFTSSGVVQAELQVTNSRGVSTTQSFDVNVVAVEPQIDNVTGGGSEITAGESVTLSATASDPANRGVDISYSWGVLGDSYNGSSVTISPREVGKHDVTLSVTNEYGTVTTRPTTITVTNDRPGLAASDSTDRSFTAGQSADFTVSVEDNDASNTELAFSIDGEVIEERSVSQPLADETFSHQFSTPGEHSIAITATDGNGASTTVSWDADVTSRPPEFQNWSPEAASLSELTGNTITFDVAASDPDGQHIEYQWYIDSEYAASSQTLTQQFNRHGQYTVTAVASDPTNATRERSWDVAVKSFTQEPMIEDQISVVRLNQNSSTEFATVSLANPSVNERTARVEVIVRPPDGLSVTSTQNVQFGNPSQYRISGRADPGASMSLTLGLVLDDSSLLGRSVTVDYSVIYYPEGQRADSVVLDNSTREIAIGDQEKTASDVDQSTSGSGDGFTPITALIGSVLSVYLLVRRE